MLVVGGCGEEEVRSSERTTTQRGAVASAPRSTVPPSTPSTPAPADAPDAPQTGHTPGQVAAINVAAMVEGCFAARPDYRLCTRPQPAGHLSLPPIVDREPQPGEAQVIADSARSYTVLARDAGGTWTIRRDASGVVTRACTGPGAAACDDSTWAPPPAAGAAEPT